MGEEFIRKHTESFRHQQDLAYEKELAKADLFSGQPMAYETAYPATLVAEGCTLAAGDAVIVCKGPGAVPYVLRGNERIGVVQGAAGDELAALLDGEPRIGGLADARVHEVSGLVNTFSVILERSGR